MDVPHPVGVVHRVRVAAHARGGLRRACPQMGTPSVTPCGAAYCYAAADHVRCPSSAPLHTLAHPRCSEGKSREGSSIVVTMDDVRVIKRFCDADQGAAMTEALEKDEVRPTGGGSSREVLQIRTGFAGPSSPLRRTSSPTSLPPPLSARRRRGGTRSA